MPVGTAEDLEVGGYIAKGWVEDLEENTREQIEAAFASLSVQLGEFLMARYGPESVIQMADNLRAKADEIETWVGNSIRKRMKKSV
jgi:hypothetical protein